MRRMLAIWFPNWTIQRLWQDDPALRSAALVVSAEAPGRGLRVAAVCPRAFAAGVRVGMPLAEARALLPSVPARRSRTANAVWKSADPAADRRALQQIACELQRYTPLTGIDDTCVETILLDITGCAALFNGERELMTGLSRDLVHCGFQIRSVLADTIGAAWAIAHAGDSGTIVPPGRHQEFLEPLPIEALRISSATVDLLLRLDVRTIADVRRLPRTSLASRFGPALLKRLDQAWGDQWESFTPERLVEPLIESWNGDEPLTDQREATYIFRQLLTKLLADLSPRRIGLVELCCELQIESQRLTIPLRLARPSVDIPHLGKLFELACERQRWPGCVSAFSLEAVCIGPMEQRQTTLLDDAQPTEREINRLIEQLGSRLGNDAVLRPVCIADPLPEFSLRLVPCLDLAGGTPRVFDGRGDKGKSHAQLCIPDREHQASRPWRLLSPPEPVDVMAVVPDGPPMRLCWRGRAAVIRQAWGPERIETGWWRSRDVQRDYYRIETDAGLQFWLFRRRDTGQWFVHGTFD